RGAHPRGMAVDVILGDENGEEVDMGTPFDHLPPDRSYNPSARDCTDFDPRILQNRKMLEDSLLDAARELRAEIVPLGGEWWDFRLPNDHYNAFAPIEDAQLP